MLYFFHLKFLTFVRCPPKISIYNMNLKLPHAFSCWIFRFGFSNNLHTLNPYWPINFFRRRLFRFVITATVSNCCYTLVNFASSQRLTFNRGFWLVINNLGFMRWLKFFVKFNKVLFAMLLSLGNHVYYRRVYRLTCISRWILWFFALKENNLNKIDCLRLWNFFNFYIYFL